MNERIKALLYEAGGQYNGHNVLTGVERVDTENVDYERFAELIIQECVYVVDKAVLGREPASTYVEKILNHFEI